MGPPVTISFAALRRSPKNPLQLAMITLSVPFRSFVPMAPPHLPLKTGLRFSMKAVMPSRASSVEATSAILSDR